MALNLEEAEGFLWLAPLALPGTLTGSFDAGLSPTVQICRRSAESCAEVVATFGGAEDDGVVRVSPGNGVYVATWNTAAFDLDVGATYRIVVRAGAGADDPGIELGSADVLLAANADGTAGPGKTALVKGQALPIRFRITPGIPGRVQVTPGDATVESGGTQRFEASVLDLHGRTLEGYPVSWSSGDPVVATVVAEGPGTGLATGLAPGTASIQAVAGGARAAGSLTVLGESGPEPLVQRLDGSCQSFHFFAGTCTPFWVGDFYISQRFGPDGQSLVFFANNVGQRGVINVGVTSGPLHEVTIPGTGYSRQEVPVVNGSTYVSLAREPGFVVVFRVIALELTSVTLEWVYLPGGP